jgi:hypothetical protein
MHRTFTHGLNAYSKNKCRCPKCLRAWKLYMRDYRSRKRRGRRARGFFRNKLRRGLPVRLTDLGMQIMSATVARTGKSPDDVMEAALRCCGRDVHFDDRAA